MSGNQIGTPTTPSIREDKEIISSERCALPSSEIGAPSAPPADRWQPIETAPKDRVLLLYGPIGALVTDIHPKGAIRACGYWDDIDGTWAFTNTTWEGPFSAPTHWMPLPPPPPERGPR